MATYPQPIPPRPSMSSVYGPSQEYWISPPLGASPPQHGSLPNAPPQQLRPFDPDVRRHSSYSQAPPAIPLPQPIQLTDLQREEGFYSLRVQAQQQASAPYIQPQPYSQPQQYPPPPQYLQPQAYPLQQQYPPQRYTRSQSYPLANPYPHTTQQQQLSTPQYHEPITPPSRPRHESISSHHSHHSHSSSHDVPPPRLGTYERDEWEYNQRRASRDSDGQRRRRSAGYEHDGRRRRLRLRTSDGYRDDDDGGDDNDDYVDDELDDTESEREHEQGRGEGRRRRSSHGGGGSGSGGDKAHKSKHHHDIDKRPTLSDSMVLVWDTLKAAWTGKRE